jgi:hypothetical protein
VNEHQLLATLKQGAGVYNLVLFDLQTRERRVIQRQVGLYGLSPDGRYLAVHEGYLMRFFDLSLERAVPIKVLNVEGALDSFTWQDHELIVLFTDRSLRAYAFETGAWRTIAIIPGDERVVQRVPCAH